MWIMVGHMMGDVDHMVGHMMGDVDHGRSHDGGCGSW